MHSIPDTKTTGYLILNRKKALNGFIGGLLGLITYKILNLGENVLPLAVVSGIFAGYYFFKDTTDSPAAPVSDPVVNSIAKEQDIAPAEVTDQMIIQKKREQETALTPFEAYAQAGLGQSAYSPNIP